MGKITGFMDYTRKTSTDVPPLERIENFNEFHVWLSREEQQTQAARCMDCGRSEERRVGKECPTSCRSRWSPYH